jgi:phospholipid N-methyltransferase
MNSQRHRSEIEQFRELWKGGYFEGDPLDPMAPSGYGHFGYISSLHATYLRCIRPYVNDRTTVLEIGPGRGAWTKCFIERKAKLILALDALSAEHNEFWDYVGHEPNVQYFQVQDNLCSVVPDESVDYFFSFGTFCHISPQNINDYMKSIFVKMRPGAVGFVMVADYEKFNSMLAAESKLSISRSFVGRRLLPIRMLWGLIFSVIRTHKVAFLPEYEDDVPRPGRWYHLGTRKAVEMLRAIGFNVIDADVGVNHRDPIIHFEKPVQA